MSCFFSFYEGLNFFSRHKTAYNKSPNTSFYINKIIIYKNKSIQEKYKLKNKGSIGVAEHAIVATYNVESSRVGLAILKSGGSTIDACFFLC
jgi:hypothetical protein